MSRALSRVFPAGFMARVNALDGAFLVSVYVALLLLVPSRLVFKPIGAAGTPANLWGMSMLMWWVVVKLGGARSPRSSPVMWAGGLFSVVILVSYALANAHGWWAPPGIRQSTDNVYDLIQPNADQIRAKMVSAADRGLLSLAGWMGVLFVTAGTLRSWAQVNRLVGWVVALGTIVAGLGLLQFFTGIDLASYIKIPGLSSNFDIGSGVTRSDLRRVNATAIHPIEFGVVMAMCFLPAMHRSLFGTHRWRWVPTAMIGSAALMSVSRSAVLFVGVALLLLIPQWPAAWRRKFLIIAPFAALIMRILIPGLLGTIRSMFTNLFGDTSTTGRTDDYGVVGPIIADHLWFGQGFFTFIPEYFRTLDNQLLVTVIELGIVGFGLMMGLFLTAYLCARGARRRSSDPAHRHLSAAIAVVIVGSLLCFGTFDALSFPMAAGGTFFFIGLAGAIWRIADDERRAEAQLREAVEPSDAGLDLRGGGLVGVGHQGRL